LDHGSFDNCAMWLTALVYHCQAIRFGSCSSASPCYVFVGFCMVYLHANSTPSDGGLAD